MQRHIKKAAQRQLSNLELTMSRTPNGLDIEFPPYMDGKLLNGRQIAEPEFEFSIFFAFLPVAE